MPLNWIHVRLRATRSHLQALRLEPRRDAVDIVLADSEAVGILFRRQPFVIIRRTGILLAGQQLLERVCWLDDGAR